jgi:hypothetical protein
MKTELMVVLFINDEVHIIYQYYVYHHLNHKGLSSIKVITDICVSMETI